VLTSRMHEVKSARQQAPAGVPGQQQ